MHSATGASRRRAVGEECCSEIRVGRAVPDLAQAVLRGIPQRAVLVAALGERRDAARQSPAVGREIHDGPRASAERPGVLVVVALEAHAGLRRGAQPLVALLPPVQASPVSAAAAPASVTGSAKRSTRSSRDASARLSGGPLHIVIDAATDPAFTSNRNGAVAPASVRGGGDLLGGGGDLVGGGGETQPPSPRDSRATVIDGVRIMMSSDFASRASVVNGPGGATPGIAASPQGVAATPAQLLAHAALQVLGARLPAEDRSERVFDIPSLSAPALQEFSDKLITAFSADAQAQTWPPERQAKRKQAVQMQMESIRKLRLRADGGADGGSGADGSATPRGGPMASEHAARHDLTAPLADTVRALALQFAVRRHRQGFQQNERGGNHVIR